MIEAEIINNVDKNGRIYHNFKIGQKVKVYACVCDDCFMCYNENITDCQVIRHNDLRIYAGDTDD